MSIKTSPTRQMKELDKIKKEVKKMQEITLIAIEEMEKDLDLVLASSDDYFVHPEKYSLQIEIPESISFPASQFPLTKSIRQIQ